MRRVIFVGMKIKWKEDRIQLLDRAELENVSWAGIFWGSTDKSRRARQWRDHNVVGDSGQSVLTSDAERPFFEDRFRADEHRVLPCFSNELPISRR